MSIYATINGSEPIFFSSNSGWGDIVAWADSLDEKVFETIVHLTEHGYTEDIEALRKQLVAAQSNKAPEQSVTATLSELLDLLDDETESVFISDGSSGETEDGEEVANVQS